MYHNERVNRYKPTKWINYIVIGHEKLKSDDIEKSKALPDEIMIIEIENSINHCFSEYNEEIFDLDRINDILHTGNDQIVTHSISKSGYIETKAKLYVADIDNAEIYVNFKKTQIDKPEPYKTIILLIISRLIDFIEYFEKNMKRSTKKFPIIYKKLYRHEIYTQIVSDEIVDFINSFIVKAIIKQETADVFGLLYTSSEHGINLNVEKFKNLFILFVKEFFIDLYKKYANDSFMAAKEYALERKSLPLLCSGFNDKESHLKNFCQLLKLNNFSTHDHFDLQNKIKYNEYRPQMYENVSYEKLLDLVYTFWQIDSNFEEYVFIIDINYFNQIIMYFNFFLKECENIKANCIEKKLDEVTNSLLHVFFGNTAFVFNLKETDFQSNVENENSKQKEKIKINIGCDFRLGLLSYIKFMADLLPNASIILKSVGTEILFDLITLYHNYTLHALIYFFKVKRSEVFNLNFVGQYTYDTKARKMQNDPFKPNLAVNIEHLQDLAKQIVTLFVNLNIKCYEELSKKFISDQGNINTGMNTFDTDAKIAETFENVKLNYNIQ